MSDWFYPLMLVAVLAVYVLLSLQGRRDAARVVDALRGRLEALEAALRESGSGAPSDGSEAAGPAPDPAGGILDALQRSLTDQGVAVEAQSGARARRGAPRRDAHERRRAQGHRSRVSRDRGVLVHSCPGAV